MSATSETLSPNEQLVAYGEMLLKLVNSKCKFTQPIFTDYWEGDHLRTPSFAFANESRSNCYQTGETPPVAKLMNDIHAEFRRETSRMPTLDEERLQQPTQDLLQSIRDLVDEYRQVVNNTHTERKQSYYKRVDPDILTNFNRRAGALVSELYKSELATNKEMPILVLNYGDRKRYPSTVPNEHALGLYLLATSMAFRGMTDYDRNPEALARFISGETGLQEVILEKQDRKLSEYGTQDIRKAALQNFDITNNIIHQTIEDQKNALQIGAIAAHETIRDKYQRILKKLGLSIVPDRIDSPREAAVLLESLAESFTEGEPEHEQLNTLAQRLISAHKAKTQPGKELLETTQTALSQISFPAKDEYANDKVELISGYIERQRTATVPKELLPARMPSWNR